MSVRGWAGSVAMAAGVAAGAGAAQVGLGYGLGVLVWLPASGDVGQSAWVASLTWAVWIAASSTVAGALGAARLAAGASPRPVPPGPVPPGPDLAGAVPPGPDPARPAWAGHRTSWLWRWTLSVGAAVGATLSVVLVAVPARQAAGVAGPGAQATAAGYGLVGIALGLLIAVWALSSPPVARNVVVTVGWLWALAVATVVVAVVTGRVPAGAPLGSWPDWAAGSTLWFRGYVFWPAAALTLGAALVVGALVGWSVARRSDLRVGATISGGVGPAVVAAAHVIAPQQDGLSPEQISAHLVAPYAVIAGLAGSALVAGFAQHRAARTDATTRTDVTRTDLTRPAGESAPPEGDSPLLEGDPPLPEDDPALAEGHSALAESETTPRTTGQGPTGGVPDQRTSSDRPE